MNRILFVPCTLLLVAVGGSCADRHDLFVTWTIDGGDAAEGCDALSKPVIEAHIQQKHAQTDPDARTDPGVDEHAELACKDGAGTLSVASFAGVVLELLSNEDVYGASSKHEVAAASNSTFSGDSAENPLAFDIQMVRGSFRARLTVLGADCGDAGVDSFTVSLVENVGPLEDAAVVEDETVACEDGVAVFTHSPVEIGATYKVVATAAGFATNQIGEGTTTSGAVTSIVVDLRAE